MRPGFFFVNFKIKTKIASSFPPFGLMLTILREWDLGPLRSFWIFCDVLFAKRHER
jgi:hypothetical protein